MWTEEEEKNYLDLEIMRSLLLPKRTVKGDLEHDTYVQEKPVKFTRTPLFGGEISVYLPEGREEQHYGKDIMYFENMGEYTEYVVLDDSVVITIEKCKDNNFGMLELDDEDVYKHMMNAIEEKYTDAVAIFWTALNVAGMQTAVYVIRVISDIDEERCEGLIYCLSANNHTYRLYIASYKKKLDLIDALGEKIVEKIIYHN